MIIHSKKIILFLVLLLTINFVNAEILVHTNIDKNTLSTNEVAFFNVNLYNNDAELLNYPIKIETSDNLILLENENKIFMEIIDSIKEDRTKELKFRFKAINSKEEIGKIFVYYGNNLQFVSGTFVEVKELPMEIKTSAEKKSTPEGDKIFIKIEIQNKTGKEIYNVGAEVFSPNGFIVRTEPFFTPFLADQNKINYEFEILAPLEANGEQKFILAYGFFEENKPHYFEESFNISFEKRNNLWLAGIGLVILVIAIIFYVNKGSKKPDVKGTQE